MITPMTSQPHTQKSPRSLQLASDCWVTGYVLDEEEIAQLARMVGGEAEHTDGRKLIANFFRLASIIK